MKLRTKLIIIFSIIILISSILIAYISYLYLQDYVKNSVSSTIKETMDQTMQNIDYRLKEIEKLHYNIVTSETLREMLDDKNITPGEKKSYQERFEAEIFTNIFGAFLEYIDSVYIIGEKNKLKLMAPYDILFKDVSVEDILINETIIEAKKEKGRMVWQASNGNEFLMRYLNKRKLILGVRKLQIYGKPEIERGQKTFQYPGILFELGYMIIYLKEDFIEDIYDEFLRGMKGNIYLMQADGRIVSYNKNYDLYKSLTERDINKILKNRAGSHQVTNEKRLYNLYYTTSSHTAWKIVSLVPQQPYLKRLEEMKNAIIKIVVVIILISIILASLFARNITNPLSLLLNKMNYIRKGDLDVSIDIKSGDEIATVGEHFNKMVEDIKELMEKIKEDHELIRELELKALQAQINPHFLYNTLDSIYWMTQTGEYNIIGKMTVALSRFFRLGLNDGKDICTIKQEMEHVENYLKIQKYRYEDEFNYNISYQSEVANYECIKLIVQPLVENSLEHGFKEKEEGAMIFVKAWKEKDRIILQVVDNGCGFDVNRVKDIIENRENDSSSSGYGLWSIQERIQLYYGSKYGLKFFDIEQGAKIEVWLPLKEGEGDQNSDEV